MTGEIEKCTYDDQSERQLYMLDLAGPDDLPTEIALESPHFACVLCWDATDITSKGVAEVVQPLIAAGCVYFCCWGPDCERVHDVIDECDPYADAVIMTTWHSDVPIEEALWYFLNCTWPDARFEDSIKAALAITVGSDEWAAAARRSVTDPRTFSRVV